MSLWSTSSGSSKYAGEVAPSLGFDPFVSFEVPSKDVADALALDGTDSDDERVLKAGRVGKLGAR